MDKVPEHEVERWTAVFADPDTERAYQRDSAPRHLGLATSLLALVTVGTLLFGVVDVLALRGSGVLAHTLGLRLGVAGFMVVGLVLIRLWRRPEVVHTVMGAGTLWVLSAYVGIAWLYESQGASSRLGIYYAVFCLALFLLVPLPLTTLLLLASYLVAAALFLDLFLLEQPAMDPVYLTLLLLFTATLGAWFTASMRRVRRREWARANELVTSNTRLTEEVAERRRVERQLHEHREQLEELVTLRTSELRRSEERYRTLVENVDLGIMLVDQDMRVVATNSAWKKLFGHPKCGIGDNSRVCAVCPGERAMAEGHPVSVETEGLREDGQAVPIRVMAFPVRDQDGEVAGFIEVIEDISGQHAMRRERDELREMVILSQKMDAISQLAAGVARDLDGVLAPILDFTQAARPVFPDGDPLHNPLDHVVEALTRARGLTTRLRTLGRRQVLEVDAVDLNQLITGLGDALVERAGESIELQFDLAVEVGRVRVDPAQLAQVLYHLVDNAREAVTGTGEVVVETSLAVLDSVSAERLGGLTAGPYARVEVRDDGLGMDELTRARIFEPFFTTKEEGTGLGLAAVYTIVGQLGGSVVVDSGPGRGTAVSLYLPRVATPRSAPERELPRPHRADGHDTVLVVMSDEVARGLAARVLERSGLRVLQADDIAGALGLEGSVREQIDLLVADLEAGSPEHPPTLPESIRRALPEVPVLWLCGHGDNVISPRSATTTGSPVLVRPFTSLGLVRKVRELLRE